MWHHKYNFPNSWRTFFFFFLHKRKKTPQIKWSDFFNQNSQVWTDLDHKTFSILPFCICIPLYIPSTHTYPTRLNWTTEHHAPPQWNEHNTTLLHVLDGAIRPGTPLMLSSRPSHTHRAHFNRLDFRTSIRWDDGEQQFPAAGYSRVPTSALRISSP